MAPPLTPSTKFSPLCVMFQPFATKIVSIILYDETPIVPEIIKPVPTIVFFKSVLSLCDFT